MTAEQWFALLALLQFFILFFLTSAWWREREQRKDLEEYRRRVNACRVPDCPRGGINDEAHDAHP